MSEFSLSFFFFISVINIFVIIKIIQFTCNNYFLIIDKFLDQMHMENDFRIQGIC